MIKCTVCGIQNREGSKFCSNCGARIAQASGLICPMCSTPNKVESVFCEKCGARLVPLTVAPAPEKTPPATPIKGLSLPAKPVEPPATKPEAPAPEPAPSEPTVPSDWLARLRTAAPSEEETTAPQIEAESLEEQAEVADWIARLRANSSFPETETEEADTDAPFADKPAPVSDLEETPDWLRPASAAPATPLPAPEPARADEMPAWLNRLRAESAPIEESAPSVSTNEPMPDWLRSLEQPTIVEPTPAETPAPRAEQPAAFLPPLEAASPPVPISEAEMPDWLRELKPKETETVAPQETLADETLDTNLESPAPSLLTPTEPTPTWVGEVFRASTMVDEDLPDWLRTPVAAAAAEPGIALAQEAAPALEQAQVPDWIAALKPPDHPTPELEGEALETVGPLAGLRGVLPLAVAIVEPHAPSRLPLPGVRSESAHLFESVLASSMAEAGAPATARARRAWTMRPVIYLLLLLATIVPFFLPDFTSSSLPVSRVPARTFFELVEKLPANAVVLVAFDYDVSVAGEMDLIANAIVRHLIQRRAKVIAVSTVETGAQLAERVLTQATRDMPNFRYGVDYAILYVPGQEAGLTQLATTGFAANARDWSQRQPLDKLPAMVGIQTLRNIDLIVLLPGSDDRLQLWMEQVRPFKTLPVAGGVSAAVEPRASVYYDAGQLDTMFSGVLGAAQYEVLAKQHDPLAKKVGAAVTNANSQNVAQLVLVGLIILGNLAYWVARAQGKAK